MDIGRIEKVWEVEPAEEPDELPERSRPESPAPETPIPTGATAAPIPTGAPA